MAIIEASYKKGADDRMARLRDEREAYYRARQKKGVERYRDFDTKVAFGRSFNRAAASGSKGGYGGSGGVTFSNVDYEFLGNSNPMLVGGKATVNLPSGESLEIPNALAQELAFEQSFNKGTVDVGRKYFGVGGREEREMRGEAEKMGFGGEVYRDDTVFRSMMGNIISGDRLLSDKRYAGLAIDSRRREDQIYQRGLGRQRGIIGALSRNVQEVGMNNKRRGMWEEEEDMVENLRRTKARNKAMARELGAKDEGGVAKARKFLKTYKPTFSTLPMLETLVSSRMN